MASRASETSLAGYSATAAVSASGLVNLVAGSNTYQLNLTGSGQNNIAGLAQAINNADAGVSATVLTAGSTDYLSVSASSTGATTLQVNNVTPADLVIKHRHGHGNVVADLRGCDYGHGVLHRPGSIGSGIPRTMP